MPTFDNVTTRQNLQDVFQKIYLPQIVEAVVARDQSGLLSRFRQGGATPERIAGKGIFWYIDNSQRTVVGYGNPTTMDLSHLESALNNGKEIGTVKDELYLRATASGPELRDGDTAKYVNTLTRIVKNAATNISHQMSVMALGMGDGTITDFPDTTATVSSGASTSPLPFANVNRLLKDQIYEKIAADGTTVEGTFRVTAISSRYGAGNVTLLNVGGSTANLTALGTLRLPKSTVAGQAMGLEFILAPTGAYPRAVNSAVSVTRTDYPSTLVPISFDCGNEKFSRRVLDDLYQRIMTEGEPMDAGVDQQGNKFTHPYTLVMWYEHYAALAEEGRTEQRAYNGATGAKVEDHGYYTQAYDRFEFFGNNITKENTIYMPFMPDFNLSIDTPNVLTNDHFGVFDRINQTDWYEHVQHWQWAFWAKKLNSSAIITNVGGRTRAY